MKTYKELIEKKSEYILYHNTYSEAIQEVEAFAKKKGYLFDDPSVHDNKGDQLATKVGLGPIRPRAGKTNKFSFELYKKTKLQKKQLHVQIYNRGTGSNEYELNMYIS